MNKRILSAFVLLPLLAACGNEAPEPSSAPEPESAAPPAPAPAPALELTASAEGSAVYFMSPADGETVSNPVTVVFGIEGMDVVPAGTEAPHSGHHHLLVDTDLPDVGLPIPKGDQHIHFGDGSTETEITLEPGSHTLQMLLGDHLHIPHNPPLMSDTITIHVE